MKNSSLLLKYIIFDFLAASISWISFFAFRKLYIEPLKFGYEIPFSPDSRFIMGLVIIPFFWISLYYLSGYYHDIMRKSRLEDAIMTFVQTFIGMILIFFFLILDDYVSSYKNYYLLFAFLFLTHFTLTLIIRWVLTTITVTKIKNRKTGFKTLIIGGNETAIRIYNDLTSQKISTGNIFIGFADIRQRKLNIVSGYLPLIGNLQNLDSIVNSNNIEEVILALDPEDYNEINAILNKLAFCKVIIKAAPEMYAYLSGRVKMDHLYGTPLIQVSRNLISPWQDNIKNLIDILASIVALVTAAPIMLFITIGIKLTSPGPLIYSHERIGKFGKPFRIYKFRSMCVEAESKGPELTKKDDKRLTNFGRFLRKFRLDEIPNFYNVLKGDMSIVGPRPERFYYIEKIIKIAPHYIHLQRVKPGITSWGQVKYGYAENVEQMISRLSYDMMYIDNMSLFTDFKIVFYTFLTIVRGRGM